MKAGVVALFIIVLCTFQLAEGECFASLLARLQYCSYRQNYISISLNFLDQSLELYCGYVIMECLVCFIFCNPWLQHNMHLRVFKPFSDYGPAAIQFQYSYPQTQAVNSCGGDHNICPNSSLREGGYSCHHWRQLLQTLWLLPWPSHLPCWELHNPDLQGGRSGSLVLRLIGPGNEARRSGGWSYLLLVFHLHPQLLPEGKDNTECDQAWTSFGGLWHSHM